MLVDRLNEAVAYQWIEVVLFLEIGFRTFNPFSEAGECQTIVCQGKLAFMKRSMLINMEISSVEVRVLACQTAAASILPSSTEISLLLHNILTCIES
jgi:hypothetical protein